MSKPQEKEGYEETASDLTRRIRITLTSKDVKNLEKGVFGGKDKTKGDFSLCGVDHGSEE